MHLSDCFVELLAYVAYFRKSVPARQPSYDKVKEDILRLLSESESHVRNGAFPREDYDQARFMVCAWIDEAILASAWDQKGQWQREPLQRIFYQTTEAGEEAFERLNALGLHQRDVREVYYLCLALGFTGRFCRKGDDFLLEQLKTSNLRILMGSSADSSSLEREELFPGSYPGEPIESRPAASRLRFSALTLVGIAGPVVLFGLLYLVYRFALRGAGGDFLRAIL